jgi:tetratricopeptide (TPR) repeat protein
MDVPYSMASVYQAQGRYDDAIKLLQDLVKKTDRSDTSYSQADRNNRAIFIERLGMVYREQENYTASVETFRKMLPLGDENAAAAIRKSSTPIAKPSSGRKPQPPPAKPYKNCPTIATCAWCSTHNWPTPVISTSRRRHSLHAEGQPRRPRRLHRVWHQIYTRPSAGPMPTRLSTKPDKLSTKPEDKEYVHFLRGSSISARKCSIRPSRIQKVLEADPQAACHAQLSRLHERRPRRETRRIAQLHQAGLSFEPNNGAYLDSLGWAYFKLGKYDLAEENLTKAGPHGLTPRCRSISAIFTENRPPETRRRPLGALRSGMEQDRFPRAVDTDAFAKVQQKLDAAKVKLAKEEKQTVRQ